jgi:DNA-binding transcriptional regulator YhcF (GntR family)
MAQEALVNPNTVGKAYRELEFLGVVLGRNGSGVFVTAGGVAIAQRQRRAATMASFGESARQALRAGHDEADLIEVLGEVIAATVARITPGTGETAQTAQTAETAETEVKR